MGLNSNLCYLNKTMKKKVLIVGQVPKEYGGSYTTGVANVIVNLLKSASSNDSISYILWASNLSMQRGSNLNNYEVYGISKKHLLIQFLNYLIKFPFKVLNFKKYHKYGMPHFRSLLYEISIYHLMNKIHPDIIHVHNIAFLPSTYFANVDRAKIILTFHGIFHNDAYSIEQGVKKGIDIRKLFINSCKLASSYSVLTKSMMDYAVSTLGLDYHKIKIIPNGVSNNFHFDYSSRVLKRNEMGIRDNEILFISVGALTKRKNHIRAIKFLQNNIFDFKFIIVGREGDFKAQLIDEVERDDRISLIEYISNNELYKYYSAADYFLMPSTQEGQALVCLEALASGLNVLINEEISETLGYNDEFKGFYYSVCLNDENYTFSKVLNTKERLQLSKRSKHIISWEKVSEKYLEFYKKYIKN